MSYTRYPCSDRRLAAPKSRSRDEGGCLDVEICMFLAAANARLCKPRQSYARLCKHFAPPRGGGCLDCGNMSLSKIEGTNGVAYGRAAPLRDWGRTRRSVSLPRPSCSWHQSVSILPAAPKRRKGGGGGEGEYSCGQNQTEIKPIRLKSNQNLRLKQQKPCFKPL